MKDWLRQHLGVFLSGLALLAVTQLWVSLALETPWPDAAARTLVNALFGAGIIAYIRHPGSRPGTLGDLWAGGTASCHRGQLIFQEAMSRTDIELGSPTKFDVVAATDVPGKPPLTRPIRCRPAWWSRHSYCRRAPLKSRRNPLRLQGLNRKYSANRLPRCPVRWIPSAACSRLPMEGVLAHDVSSAVKDRPANVVAQPLVVKHEPSNGLRKLVTLPLALTPSCVAGIGSRGSCGLDGIGGSTQFVCSDVRDGPGLARRVRSIPGRPPQVPGRAHRMSTRGASLHHLDLTTCPSPGMLDRLAGSRVLRVGHLKQVENVLCARCRPQRQKLVVRIGQAATAPDRHKAGVSDLRQNHVDILLTGLTNQNVLPQTLLSFW